MLYPIDLVLDVVGTTCTTYTRSRGPRAPLVKWHNTGFVIRDWQFDSVKGHQITFDIKYQSRYNATWRVGRVVKAAVC